VASRRMSRRRSLLGNMTDMQRRLQFLESRPSSYKLASQVVRRVNVQAKAIGTDQLANQGVTTSIIATDAVTNDKLSNNSVTTDNITPGNVTTGTLADGAVTTAKLADSAVTTAKIADLNVTTAKIANGNVTEAKIADSAVTTAKIANGSVTDAKIGSSAVTNSKIAGGAVTSDKISDGAVTSSKIAGGAVTSDKISDGAVTNSKIGTGAVTTSKIETKTIFGIKIEDATIPRGKLNFNTVTSINDGSGINVTNRATETPTISVDSSVSRSGHTHAYAPVNHDHNYASSTHVHSVGGGTGVGPRQNETTGSHTHYFSDTSTGPFGSSLKLKKNIQSYKIDTSKLLKLNLVSFEYLNQYKPHSMGRDTFYGYIAEELADIGIEEPLTYDQDGSPKGINYWLIGVLALELAKEQEIRITTLERQIKQMMREDD